MRKMILSFIALGLFASSAFAGTSFTVRVSFTIPQRIEVGGCHKDDNKQQQPQNEYNNTVKTTTQEETVIRNNTTCLVRTVLAK